MFYVGKTIEQGLSRDALINCFKAHLYEHQGKIVNNFSDHLPDVQSRLVQEVLKENYDFSFATVEHDPYEERELEEALTEALESHYSSDSRVNQVYRNQAGTIMIDCRN